MYVYIYMYISVCLYTISPIIMWGLPFEYLSFGKDVSSLSSLMQIFSNNFQYRKQ